MSGFLIERSGQVSWGSGPAGIPGGASIAFEAGLADLMTLRAIRGDRAARGVGLDGVPGRSLVGRLVDVPERAGDLKPGQRVAFFDTATCGTCPACRSDVPAMCSARVEGSLAHGTFRSLAAADPSRLLAVPDGLPAERAAQAALYAIVLRSLDTKAQDGQAVRRLAVVGMGFAGRLAVAAARRQGIEWVHAVGLATDPPRPTDDVTAAMIFGADEFREWIRADPVARAPELVLIATPDQAALPIALSAVGRRGQIILLEAPQDDQGRLANYIQSAIQKELIIRSLFWSRPSELRTAMKLLLREPALLAEGPDQIAFAPSEAKALQKAAAASVAPVLIVAA